MYLVCEEYDVGGQRSSRRHKGDAEKWIMSAFCHYSVDSDLRPPESATQEDSCSECSVDEFSCLIGIGKYERRSSASGVSFSIAWF